MVYEVKLQLHVTFQTFTDVNVSDICWKPLLWTPYYFLLILQLRTSTGFLKHTEQVRANSRKPVYRRHLVVFKSLRHRGKKSRCQT